jgi:hypothetical protein
MSNRDIVVPNPDNLVRPGQLSCELKFSVPDGHGGLKEAPSDICDSELD